MKKLLKILFAILLSLIILVLVMWVKSPGTTEPITDLQGEVIPNSISTIEKVIIGGIEQTLIIRGRNKSKPVILFLHGGPGSPEIAFVRAVDQPIEDDFVMVYWEQRGAGKSYSSDMTGEYMTIEQFIADTKELSELLAKRFNQEKIYIMGHSWGSLLGILTAQKYPELYYAYFGIGQVCNQYEGERVSLEWVRAQAQELNDEEAIEELAEISLPDFPGTSDDWLNYLRVQRGYVNKFGGGAAHNETSNWAILKMLFDAKEYTLKEKVNIIPATLFSLKHLFPDVMENNLFNEPDSMQIPVYIFQGKYDYQTPTVLAKDFYDQLKAPQKEFFLFENSAHSPIYEEIEKFNSIIKEKTGNQ